MWAQGRKPAVCAGLNYLKRLRKRRTFMFALCFWCKAVSVFHSCVPDKQLLCLCWLCTQTARKGVAGRYIILCLPQDCADKINREQVPYKPLRWVCWRLVVGALVNGVVVHLAQMTIHSPGYGMEQSDGMWALYFSAATAATPTQMLKVYIIIAVST